MRIVNNIHKHLRANMDTYRHIYANTYVHAYQTKVLEVVVFIIGAGQVKRGKQVNQAVICSLSAAPLHTHSNA